MPLIFAFRVVDCVMAMGVKVIFQIGLGTSDIGNRPATGLTTTGPAAVLKIKGEDLLEITDDGLFINLMRSYFSTLGESAHPDHSDPRVRAITNFQELLVVAFREFNVITEETIHSERKRFRAIIADEIEMFSKRAAVRNLKFGGKFNKDQVTTIYDKFFAALSSPQGMNGAPSPKPGLLVTPGSAQDSAGRLETRIDLKTFKLLLSDICSWARDEIIYQNAFSKRTERKVAEHELVERLFYSWDTSHQGNLSLQVGPVRSPPTAVQQLTMAIPFHSGCCHRAKYRYVRRLDGVYRMVLPLGELRARAKCDEAPLNQILSKQHDQNKDGFLSKNEVIQLSESLLVSSAVVPHATAALNIPKCSSSSATNQVTRILQLFPSSS